MSLDRRAKYYTASVGYDSFSPTFQTQSGFINQTNRREFSFRQALSYFPNKPWFSEGEISSFADWRHDFTGQLQERFLILSLENQFAGQTELEVSYLPLNDERFRGKFFTGIHRWTIEASTSPLEEISLSGEVEFGRDVFRSRNPVLGKGYDVSASVMLQPVSRFQLDLSYNYSALSSTDGATEFFSGNILRMTSRFHFSRELFVRLITQYNSFDDQIQVYPLVNYQLNPFTRFYIGMTDFLNQPEQGRGLGDFRETNRQFFVKFQYLFRY